MDNLITCNINGLLNKEDKDDEVVKFTLKLPSSLNQKVVDEASKLGLSKLSYIRMILSQAVNK